MRHICIARQDVEVHMIHELAERAYVDAFRGKRALKRTTYTLDQRSESRGLVQRQIAEVFDMSPWLDDQPAA